MLKKNTKLMELLCVCVDLSREVSRTVSYFSRRLDLSGPRFALSLSLQLHPLPNSSRIRAIPLPCPALRCTVLPCSALPRPALPCPALPCPALPCPALYCDAAPNGLPTFVSPFVSETTPSAARREGRPGRVRVGGSRAGWAALCVYCSSERADGLVSF